MPVFIFRLLSLFMKPFFLAPCEHGADSPFVISTDLFWTVSIYEEQYIELENMTSSSQK
jgi:hypothetical protein